TSLLLEPHRSGGVEVVVQLLGDILNYSLRLYAISRVIKRRSKNSDRTFARRYRDDAAANSALCRQAHTPGPSTGTVVETGHGHGAENFRNVVGFNDSLPRRRVHAVIRQRGAHACELDRIHAHRALFRVDINRLEWIGIDSIVFGEEIGKSFVAGVSCC